MACVSIYFLAQTLVDLVLEFIHERQLTTYRQLSFADPTEVIIRRIELTVDD